MVNRSNHRGAVRTALFALFFFMAAAASAAGGRTGDYQVYHNDKTDYNIKYQCNSIDAYVNGGGSLRGVLECNFFKLTANGNTLVALSGKVENVDVQMINDRSTLQLDYLDVANLRVENATGGSTSYFAISGSAQIDMVDGGARIFIRSSIKNDGVPAVHVAAIHSGEIHSCGVKIQTDRVYGGKLVEDCSWIRELPENRGANSDCAKTKSAPDAFVCSHAAISALDTTFARAYKETLGRATGKDKLRLVTEEDNWFRYVHNVCKDETCFKHAYWSRLAELDTFFAPHSPLYTHEGDKAEAIKEIVVAIPQRLYATDLRFCDQALADLKTMHDIHFLDPVVQTLSYADPALDEWRRRYEGGYPLNFENNCLPGFRGDIAAISRGCNANYGLPPFKIFKVGSWYKPTYIFYYDGVYGPLNWASIKPSRDIHGAFKRLGSGSSDEDTTRVSTQMPNYNSVIEYHGQEYFLMVARPGSPDYAVRLTSVSKIVSGGGNVCVWGTLPTLPPVF